MNKDFYTMASIILKSEMGDAALDKWLSDKSFIYGEGNIEKFAEDNASKPYKYNIWTYVCIEAIRRNLIVVPKIIFDKRTETVIDKHPLLDLFKKPNPDSFGTSLFEQIIVNLLLDGQIWLLTGNREKIGRGVIPKELYVTQDKYMEADTKEGKIVKWNYKPSSKVIPYNKDELIRIYKYNPYDSTKGLAPLDAAYIAIQLYGKITSFNANFFKNGAALSGIIEIDKPLKKEQADKIQKEFDAQHSGEDKAGKTPVFHGGMKWNQVSSSHKDMLFKEQYEFTKEEILSAFGVPKNQIGDFADQNYSNAVEANRSFWEDALLPIDKHICEAITYQCVSALNPDWELRSDYSSIEALNNVPKEKIEAFEKLVTNGVPRKEAARVLNIPVDWKNVEQEEKENEAKNDEKKKKEDERLAAQQAQQQTTEEEDPEDVNTEDDQKALKSFLNKFFTDLRNKCMSKVDNKEDGHFNVDEEYNTLVESLKNVYLPVIKSFVAASKAINGEVNIQPIEIVRLLNSRSKAFYDVLVKLNEGITDNKKEIHDLFQDQYGKNKEMAKDEIDALYSQIVRINA